MKNSTIRDSRRRHRTILFMAVVLLLPVFFVSCQELFTYSLLEGLQRDPSDLPAEQQISYAENALASGDTAAMADIYDEIVALAADDPEQYALAAQLAFALSGVTDIMEAAGTGQSSADIETLAEGMDPVMLSNVSTNVANAMAAGVNVPDDVYVAAAGAELLAYLSAGGDDTIPDPSTWDTNPNPQLQNAWDYLSAAGQDPVSIYNSLEP